MLIFDSIIDFDFSTEQIEQIEGNIYTIALDEKDRFYAHINDPYDGGMSSIAPEWDDDKTGTTRPDGIQYGFSAQNIQAVFPHLVTEDALGFLQTAYGTYDAMYVEAFRALNKENESLKERVEDLESQVAKISGLEAILEALQTKIKQ